MATFRNREGKLVTVTIDGVSGYEVQSCSIMSNDISANMMGGNIITSAITLGIETSNNNIYTGSLVGKEMTVSVDSMTYHFTIVSNVADMDANYASEVIQIEAVDDLTLLKNERYDKHGYMTLDSILIDLLEKAVVMRTGTELLRPIKFNVDALYTDDGATAPTKFEVLQAICKYINRSCYYLVKEGFYVLYQPSSTAQDWEKVGTFETPTTVFHRINYTIDGTTIAETGRRVGLEDPWQSAHVTAKFGKDVETHTEKRYFTEDEGTLGVYDSKTAKYYCYWGLGGGHAYDVTDNLGTEVYTERTQTVSDETIGGLNAKTIPHNTFGGQPVSLASGICDETGDVEGNVSLSEMIMLYGITAKSGNSRYLTPFWTETINTSVVCNSDAFLVIGGTVLFSRYPVPEDNKTQTYASAAKWLRQLKVTLTFDDDTTVYKYCYPRLFNDGSKTITNGQNYSICNDVYWRHAVDTTGYITNLGGTLWQGASNINGKLIKKITIDVYPGVLWTPSAVANIIANYEFITLTASVTHKVSNDSGEDTVYKWVNDDENAVICSGTKYTDSPKYVTYDGKRGGSNCPMKGNVYVTKIDDKVPERVTVEDIAEQYATNTFSDNVIVKGRVWFNNYFTDSFFSKNCAAASVSYDMVENESTIVVKEIKSWN